MTSKSPNKRASQIIAALSEPSPIEEKPSWEDVDSQISVSTKLSIEVEPPLGIQMAIPEPESHCNSGVDEYHSCPEDIPVVEEQEHNGAERKEKNMEKNLSPHTLSSTINTDDMMSQDGVTIHPKDTAALFEMMGEMTEKMKAISNATALIPTIQSELQSMANQITTLQSNFQQQISDVSSRVLINEEEIKSLQREFQSEKSFLNSHVKPVIRKLEKGGLMEVLTKEVIAKIEKNETSLSDLKSSLDSVVSNTSMDQTAHYGLNDEEMQTIARYLQQFELERDEPSDKLMKISLEKVEENVRSLLQANTAAQQRIHKLEGNISQLQKVKPLRTDNQLNHTDENHTKNPPAANETLDHNAIFIGDSNTRDIDMSKLGHGVSRKRFTCYTIPQAMNFLNTATINRQPKKVLLHLGTNDVVSANEEQLKNSFQKLISLTRSKFPDARIYISSIFVRMQKSDPLNKLINNTNNFLEDFCDKTARYTFMNNSNISHKNMRDPKHVNPKGFHMFICNIRAVVFGELYYQSRQRGR